MNNKCPFADLFGKPKQGVHAHRTLGFASVDILLTIAAAKIIAAKKQKAFGVTLLQLFVLAIVVHRLLGVDTALNQIIFNKKMEDLL